MSICRCPDRLGSVCDTGTGVGRGVSRSGLAVAFPDPIIVDSGMRSFPNRAPGRVTRRAGTFLKDTGTHMNTKLYRAPSEAPTIEQVLTERDALRRALEAAEPMVEYFHEREGCPNTRRLVSEALHWIQLSAPPGVYKRKPVQGRKVARRAQV